MSASLEWLRYSSSLTESSHPCPCIVWQFQSRACRSASASEDDQWRSCAVWYLSKDTVGTTVIRIRYLCMYPTLCRSEMAMSVWLATLIAVCHLQKGAGRRRAELRGGGAYVSFPLSMYLRISSSECETISMTMNLNRSVWPEIR